MSWLRDYKYCWYETLAMNILKMGPIPRHIAFIMDGNRRFAKHSNINKIDGHTKGFDKLSECLRWCLDMGIEEVTAFAFSIENFKRNQDEVNELLNLAKEKFEQLLQEENDLREKGVRIRILGNIKLLPNELQKVIAKAMLITENNNKLFLNIAFAYTSHDEISNSIQSVIEDFDQLDIEDINEYLLAQCLYTKNSPDPDLLIRTSGENRISDFLMWQLSATVLFFTNTLWPQLTIWHYLYGIFSYQRSTLTKPNSFDNNQQLLIKKNEILPERVQNFLRKVDARRRDVLVNLANSKFKDD